MLTYLILTILVWGRKLSITPFYRGRNWGTEMLINLLKLTIMSSGSEIRPEARTLNCQNLNGDADLGESVMRERGETWAGMFPDGPGFLWIKGDKHPLGAFKWKRHLSTPFSPCSHPFWWRCPSSSLTAHCLSTLGFCCVVLGSAAAQETNAVTWVATQSRWGALRVRERRRVFEGNWKGCKSYVSFMCN